ncbi:TetR/AcrR family transcriptional regulator [Burkholderia multivorans]|uniref:TetR/AcrR family transcriptional regulator n=1 Tax=Burkholderia multivorans TaxID=87883 RepID=UPI001C233DCB|nr:TetR/AcrR family transcriptional regulator [Burkholderia multivorans]MBU9165484.1 TetR/AcrR family transcriptional regulator [Burkholderia multivorans]MBU9491549.1 TetR/AcrR family transcriptional regulator [Burkholderia multivorans]
MKPARLTRSEKQRMTRERLLRTAYVLFVRKGYVATSIEQIAATAGYSRGAFYSNFTSKAELLLELLRRDLDDAGAQLQCISEAGGEREEVERMVVSYLDSLLHQRGPFLLWMEARLQAARDPHFRAGFGPFVQERQDRMSACIRALTERAGVPLRLPAEVLALGLIGLCDGLQSCYTIITERRMKELTDAMLTGFVAHTVFDRAR